MATAQEALNECAKEWKRGVHSFHGAREESDLEVHDFVVENFVELLTPAFREHLEVEPRRSWDEDKKIVLRTAFYGGALAACYAYGDRDLNQGPEEKTIVDQEHAARALYHVSESCKGRNPDSDENRPIWIYCPWSTPEEFSELTGISPY